MGAEETKTEKNNKVEKSNDTEENLVAIGDRIVIKVTKNEEYDFFEIKVTHIPAVLVGTRATVRIIDQVIKFGNEATRISYDGEFYICTSRKSCGVQGNARTDPGIWELHHIAYKDAIETLNESMEVDKEKGVRFTKTDGNWIKKFEFPDEKKTLIIS